MIKLLGVGIFAAITVRAWIVALSYNCPRTGFWDPTTTACYEGADAAAYVAIGLSVVLVAYLVVPPVLSRRRQIAAWADDAIVSAAAASLKAKRAVSQRARNFAARIRERAST